MIYGKLIEKIAHLGFSDLEEVNDFGSLVPDSINDAITTINLEVCPNVKTYEFSVADDDDPVIDVDMGMVVSDFLDFADTPVEFEKDDEVTYSKFNDFEIESARVLKVFTKGNAGSYRVFYKASHTPFVYYDASQLDSNALQNARTIPLPEKVHHLVPLLAAYFIWLDDEPSKAAQYYNLYEQRVNAMMADLNRPRVKIIEGGI